MVGIKRVITISVACLFAMSLGPAVAAASKTEKPKPRKEIMKKFGLTEDPGTDPDPEKVFVREGVKFTIIKIPRIDTREGVKGDGWVRFKHMQAQDLEVYQEDADYVWVFYWKRDPYVPDVRYAIDDSGKRIKIVDLPPPVIESFKEFRTEFVDVSPAVSGRTVVFKQSSSGLATAGSWRNAADTADMNGDGFIDIIVPPQRGASTTPTIYLGDGSGNWSVWERARWPYVTDYGSVSAADLNGDGHIDVAQAVHLRGPVVYLGDSKGEFVDASGGLPGDFPIRRLRIGDVDADGDLDLVAISEGPTKGRGNIFDQVKIRAYLNDGTGMNWTEVVVGGANETLGGDWMDLADLNGDEYPDIVGSSIFYGGRYLIQLSAGPAKWEAFGPGVFPIESYYFSLATGKFSGGKHDDAIMSFQRNWRYDVDPKLVAAPKSGRLSGIERVSWDEDGAVTRTPIVQWLGVRQELGAMGSGDFDGDGNLDLAFVDTDLIELTVLLGDGKGGFTSARVDGVTLPDNDIYDILVSDVNADGRQDLVLLFEAGENKKNGSVRVYLGMGVKSDGDA